ncbi:hypothetical protein LINPERHAP1_LOCUS36415 [Linum perenne]
MKEGDKPMEVPLTMAEFWVQLYEIPRSFYIEPVAKAIGNFIGTYIKSDKGLHGFGGDEFMRIRVQMDVRRALKREKKIKRPGGNMEVCTLRYEKLPMFCFLCGLSGPI